jgi:serine/threonine protein kinase
MNENSKSTILSTSESFCSEMGYADLKSIGEGMHSVIFKALENKNTVKEKVVCFKIVSKEDFEKSQTELNEKSEKKNDKNCDEKVDEWFINKLLKKFLFVYVLCYFYLSKIRKGKFIISIYEKIIYKDHIIIFMDYSNSGVF